MFVFIGARPRTEWLDGDVGRDDHGFVVGEGSIAVQLVHEVLRGV